MSKDDLCADICAPGGSGIVDTLVELGYRAVGLPDAFVPNIYCEWVITNPPYKRPLVDDIIKFQLAHLEQGNINGLAVLVRSYFDHAKTRASLFQHPLYYGQIKLLFRPWWSEDRSKSPIHNFVWQVWAKEKTLDMPMILYSEGRKRA